jgi:predicted nuclease of restriction endonuclease-like RecB superfamily
LLPDRLIPAQLVDGEIEPQFLVAADLPWVEALLVEADRYRGRPIRELEARLQAPLPCVAPRAKERAAVACVRETWRTRVRAAIPPPRARAFLFGEAARQPAPREQLVAAAAERLAVDAATLLSSLFADLPGERIVTGPPTPVGAAELALRTNGLIARSLLARAAQVRIESGAVETVARLARRWGLLCRVVDGTPPLVTLSGPFALFRRTLLYGRAMAALLAVLPDCGRFVFTADCLLRGEPGRLRLTGDAPLFPAGAIPVERRQLERLARELGAVERDPPPVHAGDELLFADFRIDGVYVEILGFWTPDHVAEKLRRASGVRWLVCVDDERRCADGDPPAGVLRYRRRLGAKELLTAIAEVPR